MTLIFDAARDLQSFCEGRGWRYCFIGGIAVQHWSEPRATRDADLTLLTGFGGEDRFIDALLGRFAPRRPEAREWAVTRRVLLLQHENGTGMDVAMGAFPFEELATRRARDITFAVGCTLRICSAEDLIVFKAFASRVQDWRDVEMTIVRQGDEKLDWAYIFEQLTPLAELKEEPAIVEQLKALRRRLQRVP